MNKFSRNTLCSQWAYGLNSVVLPSTPTDFQHCNGSIGIKRQEREREREKKEFLFLKSCKERRNEKEEACFYQRIDQRPVREYDTVYSRRDP